MDTYLSRLLKFWVAGFNPPENGRADLLRRAAAQQLPASLLRGDRLVRLEIWKERPEFYSLPLALPLNGWLLQTIAPSAGPAFDLTSQRPLIA